MRKIFTGILALLYLIMSCGVVLEVHYCMGKIASIDFFAAANDTCGRCGMKEKKSGCCHDELKIYKLENEHKQVSNLPGMVFHSPAAVPPGAPVFNWQLPVMPDDAVVTAHAPPDDVGAAIYIRNCVFRI